MKLKMPPTRGNLVKAARAMVLAQGGHDLLEQKRQVLMMELVRHMDAAKSLQKDMASVFSGAYESLQRANVSLGIDTVEEIAQSVPLVSDITVRLRSVMGVEIPEVDPVDPVLPGVIIGGAVILGAYETGTGIYRLMNMQGLPLPSNRIELAELVWERAGKPEPQNMTDEDLYADIDAADTDAQKAAHWMVEQELMKFDEDNNKFHPCFPVSKLRVCLTWQNAKDKGLID